MLTRCVSVIERAEAHRLSVMGDEKRVTIVVRKGENVSVIVSVEKPPPNTVLGDVSACAGRRRQTQRRSSLLNFAMPVSTSKKYFTINTISSGQWVK